MQQSKVFIKIFPYFQFVTKVLPLLVIVLGGFLVMDELSLAEPLQNIL